MLARHTPQVVVEIVQQGNCVFATVPQQRLCCLQSANRVTLGHYHIRKVMRRLFGVGEHNIEVSTDVRVGERLQKADVCTRCQHAAVESLRDNDQADPSAAPQVHQVV